MNVTVVTVERTICCVQRTDLETDYT